MRATIVLTVFLCLQPAIQPVASADPVQITVGSFRYDLFGEGFGTFSGDGFTLEPIVIGRLIGSCHDCPVGERVDVGGTETFANAGAADANSEPPIFRIGGERFELSSGRLHFRAAPMIAPNVELSGGALISVPFNVSGFLLGEGASGIGRVDLIGRGIVTADFGGDVEGPISGIARRHQTNFVFEGPAPVPEPATFVLLATGLAVAGRRRWKKRAG